MLVKLTSGIFFVFFYLSYQFNVVSGLLDDTDGIVDVPGRLAVDGDELVVLADPEPCRLS